VFRALDDVRFQGWIVVELDAVPDPTRTAKRCAELNRDYITRQLGFAL
jgi:inosose dehydratase